MSTGPGSRRARRRRREPMETPEYAQMLKRMIRRYGERVGDADEVDLAEMLEVERAMQEAIRTAVRLQIAAGRSWSEVATGLGTTKQAAHLRFGPASNRMSPV